MMPTEEELAHLRRAHCASDFRPVCIRCSGAQHPCPVIRLLDVIEEQTEVTCSCGHNDNPEQVLPCAYEVLANVEPFQLEARDFAEKVQAHTMKTTGLPRLSRRWRMR
jgi:hypothetical protein